MNRGSITEPNCYYLKLGHLAESTKVWDVGAVRHVFRQLWHSASMLSLGADGFLQKVPDTFAPASV